MTIRFDPIDAADYYGLAGIFKSTRTMETYTKVAKWHEHLLPSAAATAMQAQYDAELANRKQAVADFVAKADQQVRDNLAADAKPPENLETLYPEATKADLKKLRDELATLEKTPPDLPTAMGVTEDRTTDVAIQIRGNPLKLGDVVPRRTPPVIRNLPTPEILGNRKWPSATGGMVNESVSSAYFACDCESDLAMALRAGVGPNDGQFRFAG